MIRIILLIICVTWLIRIYRSRSTTCTNLPCSWQWCVWRTPALQIWVAQKTWAWSGPWLVLQRQIFEGAPFVFRNEKERNECVWDFVCSSFWYTDDEYRHIVQDFFEGAPVVLDICTWGQLKHDTCTLVKSNNICRFFHAVHFKRIAQRYGNDVRLDGIRLYQILLHGDLIPHKWWCRWGYLKSSQAGHCRSLRRLLCWQRLVCCRRMPAPNLKNKLSTVLPWIHTYRYILCARYVRARKCVYLASKTHAVQVK